jgi:hypothetical protein
VNVRILSQLKGIIDGVSLSHLLPGLTYDISASLGVWLIGQGFAEYDQRPGALSGSPLEETPASVTGGVTVTPSTVGQAARPSRGARIVKKRR